jgi:hypothetical protein
LKVNTKNYGGQTFRKTAQVVTNDPDKPVLSLAISGPVEKFALIKPAIVSLRGYTGSAIKRTVAIRPLPKYPFRIVDIEARDGKFIEFDLADDTTAGKKGYLLTVFNTRSDRGSYRDTIILKTDSKLKPELSLPVYGFVRNRPAAPQKSHQK